MVSLSSVVQTQDCWICDGRELLQKPLC
uniref:Telomere repeat-binding protein 5 n=1 Tax=Rhizophora mucronata TaxID=61149 RepID=A0A2P2JKL8_RHIMU